MKFVSSILSTVFGTEELKAMAELEKEQQDPENPEDVIKSNIVEYEKEMATKAKGFKAAYEESKKCSNS